MRQHICCMLSSESEGSRSDEHPIQQTTFSRVFFFFTCFLYFYFFFLTWQKREQEIKANQITTPQQKSNKHY